VDSTDTWHSPKTGAGEHGNELSVFLKAGYRLNCWIVVKKGTLLN